MTKLVKNVEFDKRKHEYEEISLQKFYSTNNSNALYLYKVYREEPGKLIFLEIEFNFSLDSD